MEKMNLLFFFSNTMLALKIELIIISLTKSYRSYIRLKTVNTSSDIRECMPIVCRWQWVLTVPNTKVSLSSDAVIKTFMCRQGFKN